MFRFAWTMGYRDETPHMGGEIDPVIRSSSLAYTNGPLWLAVTWQDHEDWSAAAHGRMESSDAESIRIAGRYIMDLGDGVSVQLSAMWEDVEYEFNGVTSVDAAMEAFGYGDSFMKTGNLDAPNFERAVFKGMEFMFDPINNADHRNSVFEQKTLRRLYVEATTNGSTAPNVYEYRANGPDGTANTDDDIVTYGRIADDGESGTVDTLVTLVAYVPPIGANTLQDSDDTPGNGLINVPTHYDPNYDTMITSGSTGYDANKAAAASLKAFLDAWGAAAKALSESTATDDMTYVKNYNDFVTSAKGNVDMNALQTAHSMAQAALEKTHEENENMRAQNSMYRQNIGGNVKIERDAWMVSGKIKFGGPVDFRFSYADADDLEVSCGACSGDWDESGGDAWNVGLFLHHAGWHRTSTDLLRSE